MECGSQKLRLRIDGFHVTRLLNRTKSLFSFAEQLNSVHAITGLLRMCTLSFVSIQESKMADFLNCFIRLG